MGPGYFPILLGTVLALLGVDPGGALARHRRRAPSTRLHLVPLGIITLGVVLFGVLLEPLGLVIVAGRRDVGVGAGEPGIAAA